MEWIAFAVASTVTAVLVAVVEIHFRKAKTAGPAVAHPIPEKVTH